MLRTPKLNDAETRAWPTDVFARINNLPVHRLDELLPWNWKST
ncbi:transposase domain-containing protein [Aquidulcibacter sp.]